MSTQEKSIYLHKATIAANKAYRLQAIGDTDGWKKELNKSIYYKNLAIGGNPNIQLLINPITPNI